MKKSIHFLLASFVAFIACSANAVTKANKPNVLLLCIDDLRPELNSFGVDYIHSPNIDRLAQTGRPFWRHYVNAPTCGASRYTMLTGRYGSYGNQALFQRANQMKEEGASVPPSMPEWFRLNGFYTSGYADCATCTWQLHLSRLAQSDCDCALRQCWEAVSSRACTAPAP